MRWAPLTAGLAAAACAAGRGIEHTLWPPRCVFCGERQRRSRRAICRGCNADLPWLEPARFDLEPFVAAMAPFDYAFPVDAAIKLLKFRRRLHYAAALAGVLAATASELPDDIDGVLPMPLHWRRQALRGFNQAAELARELCRVTGLPDVPGVYRARHTPYQSGLSGRQRRRNLRGAFRIREELRYRHILVVDDVVTTGATCRALAQVLLDAGVPAVSALAIARVA